MQLFLLSVKCFALTNPKPFPTLKSVQHFFPALACDLAELGHKRIGIFETTISKISLHLQAQQHEGKLLGEILLYYRGNMNPNFVAEAVRFELTEGVNLRWFSRPVP
jgi:hypothetical protein